MASHEVKTKADLLRLIDQAADEGWTELDLAGLGLEELPGEIGKLQALQTFNLFGNQIAEIPDVIANLQVLQSLNLRFTPITGDTRCDRETRPSSIPQIIP